MRVTILFFAAAREAAGTTSLTIDLPADLGTVGGALDSASASRPALAAVLPSCRTALDEEFAPLSAPLRDGSVVAVLPPVSGG